MARRLQERDEELEQLRERVGGLRRGIGGVVVVEGRAGAGKTALVKAAIATGRTTESVVRAVRAREHERTTRGALIRRLEGAPGADEPGSPREIAELGRAGPALLVVDDVHLADGESIATLLEIAERIEALALLLIVALRPGCWPVDDPRLDRLRGSAGAAVLRPSPLSVLGVARVLEDHWGSVPSDEIAEEQTAWTAGNPFLVTESALVAGERSAIPAAVAAAVGRELRRFSAAEAVLARWLAILGPGAPLRRVARLAELDRPTAERAADRLAQAGLLAPGDTLRFHAPIEGAAIAATIEPFARARAHRHAATVLSEEVADILQIADHLLAASAAGDPQVVAPLRAAADRAMAGGHPEQAARYLERALDEPPEGEERDETVLGLVNAEALCGKPTSVDRVERILYRLADGRP